MTTHMTTCSLRLAIVHLRHPRKRSGYQRFIPAPGKAAYSPRLRFFEVSNFVDLDRIEARLAVLAKRSRTANRR